MLHRQGGALGLVIAEPEIDGAVDDENEAYEPEECKRKLDRQPDASPRVARSDATKAELMRSRHRHRQAQKLDFIVLRTPSHNLLRVRSPVSPHSITSSA